tara:strand:+ start:763 stop:1287 length:525 start_codon:yes stop_codon:yes gene_type:complete
MAKKSIEKGDPTTSEDELPQETEAIVEEITDEIPKIKLTKKGKPDGRSKPRTEKQIAAFKKLRETKNRVNSEKAVIRKTKLNKKKMEQQKHEEEYQEAIEPPSPKRQVPKLNPLPVDAKRVPREPSSSVTNNYYYYGDAPDKNKDKKERKSVEEELSPKVNNIPQQQSYQLHFG